MELDKIYLGDCYQLIKNVPDKSIDLIITDPPYEFCQGGDGHSEIAERRRKSNNAINGLDTELTKRKSYTGLTSGGGCFGTKKRDYYSQIDDTDVNTNIDITHFVSKGITNEILDEMCRVMKRIYIYIYGATNNN